MNQIIIIIIVAAIIAIIMFVNAPSGVKSSKYVGGDLRELFEKECEQDNLLKEFTSKYLIVDGVTYKVRKATTGNSISNYGEYLELINIETNKVVFRKGKYSNNLDKRPCDWYYVDQIFSENI